jgi:hypothetical protein
MADHSWLVFAIRDIRDYVEMNGLNHLLPVIETACSAVERGLKTPDRTSYLNTSSHAEADVVLASLLEDAAMEERQTVPERARVKLVPS